MKDIYTLIKEVESTIVHAPIWQGLQKSDSTLFLPPASFCLLKDDRLFLAPVWNGDLLDKRRGYFLLICIFFFFFFCLWHILILKLIIISETMNVVLRIIQVSLESMKSRKDRDYAKHLRQKKNKQVRSRFHEQ